jgi:hypothetical protein
MKNDLPLKHQLCYRFDDSFLNFSKKGFFLNHLFIESLQPIVNYCDKQFYIIGLMKEKNLIQD